ncbi:MAG: hypothetical protein ACQUYJ_20550, partial [Ferruginibacter sp.]
MKANFTSISKLFTLTVMLTLGIAKTNAQCIAPAMVWQNAVLVSGTAGQPNAVYKFSSVTAGVDALVTLKSLVNGATLSNIDDNSFGYNAAWQPVVKTHTAQVAASSYAEFRIEFQNASNGSSHNYNCFQLSFIDVDGDGQHVREFVAAKNPDSVTVSQTTVLTLTSFSGNMVQATGPIANYTNIDTSAWNTNINFRYSNTDKVQEVRIGSTTHNSFTVQDRFTCGFFQQISMPVISMLPVKYFSFDAVAVDKAVVLSWITAEEINNNHFEVERSVDGTNFTTIGLVLDGFENGTKKNYKFKDNAVELQSKTVVYYRLKQVDNNGKITYTNTLVVKLQAKAGMVVQTTPNPFVENITVSFSSTESGSAEINIISVT